MGVLDRTWFNTLIDDDGSELVGTVWTKAQVDALMDVIDYSLALCPPARAVITQDLTAEASASGIRVQAYSPSIELMNKDFTRNWFVGIDDNDDGALVIGGGYGPGQGATPTISVHATAGDVTVGAAAADGPGAALNIVKDSTNAGEDWMLWLRRTGSTIPGSCHARFQQFSGPGVATEVVLSGLASRGTLQSPTAVQANDVLMLVDGRGYDATATAYGEHANGWSDGQATIRIETSEHWTNTTPGTPSGAHHGTRIIFKTTANSSGVDQVDRLKIDHDGTVEVTGTKMILGAVHILSGANTPEGAVTAPQGSLFLRTNGGANTTLYIKESGAGNTGWIPK